MSSAADRINVVEKPEVSGEKTEQVTYLNTRQQKRAVEERVEEAAPESKKKRQNQEAYDPLDDIPMNIPFEIKNGIRYLSPYWTVYRTRAKGRWFNRKLTEVFTQEFLSLNHHYPNLACRLGRIWVNGKQMRDVNYVLRSNDIIEHWGHRHEHPFKLTLKNGDWSKQYICKVEGVFPEEEITCEQPIGTLIVSMGIQCVRPNGKAAVSCFRRLWTDGTHSVVQASIETGRTHQIRVHAQYLGYPIVNDDVYNSSEVWGPSRGKGGQYGKSYEQLCEDVRASHRASHWYEEKNPEYEQRMERMALQDDGSLEMKPDSPDISRCDRPSYDPICLSCNVTKKTVPDTHFRIYLHCLKYETEKWSYSTPLPDWAIEPERSQGSGGSE